MSAQPHILMTADTIGGVWTYAIELSRALTARGARVSLATMGAPLSADQRTEASTIDGLTLYESTYKLEWMQHAWDDVDAAGRWLLELERTLQPDIVHLNGYAHGNLPWAAPSVLVAHSDVFSWWNAVHQQDPPEAAWAEYRTRVAEGLQGASVVVAISRAMAAALKAHYRVQDIEVIYNGRNPADYQGAAKEPFVLASGRVWDKAKNLMLLDQAAGRLVWPVYIAGEAQHPDEGGAADVASSQALGQLSPRELRRWMSRASVYVSPARYEPFGLSVLEAALSGCALVLSDTPSFRELWQGAAVFISQDDEEELIEAVNLFASDYKRRQEYAQKSRNRALRYTTDAMADAYLRVYSEVDCKHEAGAPCA